MFVCILGLEETSLSTSTSSEILSTGFYLTIFPSVWDWRGEQNQGFAPPAWGRRSATWWVLSPQKCSPYFRAIWSLGPCDEGTASGSNLNSEKLIFPDHSDPNKHFLRWLSNLVFLFSFSVDFRSWETVFPRESWPALLFWCIWNFSLKGHKVLSSHLIPSNFHNSPMREGYFEREDPKIPKKMWTQPWLTLFPGPLLQVQGSFHHSAPESGIPVKSVGFSRPYFGTSTSQGCWIRIPRVASTAPSW